MTIAIALFPSLPADFRDHVPRRGQSPTGTDPLANKVFQPRHGAWQLPPPVFGVMSQPSMLPCQLPARAWPAFKASILTPLNGWQFYLNNRRLMHAEHFWSWIILDHTLSTGLSRISLPVLLIYGDRDLIAPPEVGRAIYARIKTPPAQKTMVILPNSRHGAEGVDVPLMQQAIRRFISNALAAQVVLARTSNEVCRFSVSFLAEPAADDRALLLSEQTKPMERPYHPSTDR